MRHIIVFHQWAHISWKVKSQKDGWKGFHLVRPRSGNKAGANSLRLEIPHRGRKRTFFEYLWKEDDNLSSLPPLWGCLLCQMGDLRGFPLGTPTLYDGRLPSRALQLSPPGIALLQRSQEYPTIEGNKALFRLCDGRKTNHKWKHKGRKAPLLLESIK
jgi:hypothetical protein